MSVGKKPRNRERILPDERSKLDSAMVKRLKSWHELPIRTTDRALVDVEFELGRVIKNASKREKWVFSSVATERAAERACQQTKPHVTAKMSVWALIETTSISCSEGVAISE